VGDKGGGAGCSGSVVDAVVDETEKAYVLEAVEEGAEQEQAEEQPGGPVVASLYAGLEGGNDDEAQQGIDKDEPKIHEDVEAGLVQTLDGAGSGLAECDGGAVERIAFPGLDDSGVGGIGRAQLEGDDAGGGGVVLQVRFVFEFDKNDDESRYQQGPEQEMEITHA